MYRSKLTGKDDYKTRIGAYWSQFWNKLVRDEFNEKHYVDSIINTLTSPIGFPVSCFTFKDFVIEV
jgi:hypothetical protein